MRVLLDTHTFIWWCDSPGRLSERVLAMCSEPTTTMLVSIASLWEMQIKVQLAKLHLSRAVEDIVRIQQRENDVELLSIGLSEVVRLRQLPLHHRDPFDRLLVAQALVEGVPIVSVDPVFAHYPVEIIW